MISEWWLGRLQVRKGITRVQKGMYYFLRLWNHYLVIFSLFVFIFCSSYLKVRTMMKVSTVMKVSITKNDSLILLMKDSKDAASYIIQCLLNVDLQEKFL